MAPGIGVKPLLRRRGETLEPRAATLLLLPRAAELYPLLEHLVR